jgi:hypothetical protein
MSANIPASMDVPARTLPAPSTVSPQIQVIVQEPISATWNVLPKTADEWKALVTAGAAQAVSRLPAIRERLRVRSEPTMIDGVNAHILTPEVIPSENQNRLLILVKEWFAAAFREFPTPGIGVDVWHHAAVENRLPAKRAIVTAIQVILSQSSFSARIWKYYIIDLIESHRCIF